MKRICSIIALCVCGLVGSSFMAFGQDLAEEKSLSSYEQIYQNGPEGGHIYEQLKNVEGNIIAEVNGLRILQEDVDQGYILGKFFDLDITKEDGTISLIS